MGVIEPYYQDEQATIYLGDCHDVLPQLEAGSVDLVVTSPPYNQADNIDRGRGHKARWHTMTERAVWYADSMDPEAYASWQVEILEMCAAALKPDGSVMYNHKPDHTARKVVHPLDWLRRVKGLELIEEIVWARPGGMAFNAGLFVPTHEMIYWLCRRGSKPRWPTRAAMAWGSVWRMAYDREIPEHPCAFPAELPMRCIAALTEPGDLVLDCFAGSGTTARAAKNLGRQAILIEEKPEYVDLAVRRLAQQVLPLAVES